VIWQEVEREVRLIAEAVWAAPCVAEEIGGIRFDGVLKPKKDYWVLIEISKRNDLAKLREDLSKFSAVRLSLISRGIYPECHFITEGDHNSLLSTGRENNIEVHDLRAFASKFIGSSQYTYERLTVPFGSAVNPDTGASDATSYTPITYLDDDGKKYSVSDIAEAIGRGETLILLGEFGTGKSRCVKEVFEVLAFRESQFVPISINLRDNWGYKKFDHIVRNHLDSIGLGDLADNLVRSLRRGGHPLLLDGFDEIGSQSWAGDAARLGEVRRKSLEGVRDVFGACPGAGVLITGREHYFSTDAEMIECLGVPADAKIIRCPDEFSEAEALAYIQANTKLSGVPDWMPRKPLICQLLARLTPEEVDKLQESANGEVAFFESVLDAICHRETRINPAVDSGVLREILLHLAQETRCQPEKSEKIRTSEINEAFYSCTGYAPIDESAILLQRLPYLGRVGSGGSDRIFIDSYAKDGLRGLALAQAIVSSERQQIGNKWIQPLGEFGVKVFAAKAPADDVVIKYARQASAHGNGQVFCDYVTAKLSVDEKVVNFKGIPVVSGAFLSLNFIEQEIKSLHISDSTVAVLTIEDAQLSDVSIRNCLIEKVDGVGSADKLPEVFQECEFGEFKAAVTTARISELNLTNAQKTLLALIKKLFFQPGRGRQEESLLRGAEAYWDQKAANEILRYMLSSGIVIKGRGDHGILYVPQRRHTTRMAKIIEMQSSCGDELWAKV